MTLGVSGRKKSMELYLRSGSSIPFSVSTLPDYSNGPLSLA